MDSSDLTIRNARFTTNGKDVWYVRSYTPTPSCEMYNPETDEVREFGMGGSMAQEFKRIDTGKS